MTRMLRTLAVSLALSLAHLGCIVGPTNPWDEGAPPDVQVKGRLTGAAAYPSVSGEAPRAPDGIKVRASQPGTSEVLEVTTTAADDGSFAFDVTPGTWTVRAEHPSFAPASVGPVTVGPGDEIALDTLVLRLPEATSSLSGRVVAQGGLSAQGVEVTLLHATGPVGCGAVEAKVTTDDGGAFRFDPVRPGSYVVVARTEGATLDILAGDEAVTIDNDEDAVLPRDLVIEPGTSVVAIEADGSASSLTTRSPDVVVHVRPLAGMTELQLGGDPTFDPALGATGWRPYREQTAFALPPYEGEWTIYAQLRAGCVTSPLYAARVLYDPNPPEIVTAQVGTTVVDPFSPERPLAVVGAGQAGVTTTFTVIDESGVAAVHFHLGDGATVSTQTVAITPQPGQSVVRATADVPVEEGRYLLTVELEDLAGNVTPVDLSPVVDVLRDVSAPSTPIPSVPSLEVAGETALLWLEQRDCPTGERAAVCEVNPHPDGLYRVRGGALAEFAPFAAPPFEVPLAEGAESTFEILAVDAAGYTSPGAGVVEVKRHVPRVSFVAPVSKELGPHLMPRAYTSTLNGVSTFYDQGPAEPVAFYDTPALTATSGTAFFSIRPRAGGLAPYYSYLISQPADVPPAGTRWASSPWPAGIRKLNHDCDQLYACYDTYSRAAGAIGAGAGALTWIERTSFQSAPQRPYRYLLFADADGRYDIRGPETRTNQSVWVDHDGEPAPTPGNHALCRTTGRARCSEEPWAWAPLNQVAPFETAFDGRHLVTSSASAFSQRISGGDEGDVVVTGPYVLATVLAPQPGYAMRAPPLVAAIGLRIAVPAGTVLYTAAYEDPGYGSPRWDAFTFPYPDYGPVAHVARGGGEELLVVPPSTFGFDTPIALGVYIPEGVTATVPRVSVSDDGFPYRPLGLIDRGASLDPTETLTGTPYVDDPARSLDVTLFLTERDRAGLGNVAGLSLYDLGEDHEPTATAPRASDADEADEVDALADEALGQLASTRTDAVVLHTTDDATTLQVPSEACTLVVRPRFDVQLRAATLEGQGRLDTRYVRVWERSGASSVGRYEPAILNPIDTQPAIERFESLDVEDSCYDNEGELAASASATGSADAQVASSDVVDVDTPALAVLATRQASGVLAGGEFAVLALDAPDDGLPVTAGQRVRVTMTGTTGDADLYLRWDGAPTRADYHCRPYLIGSDEACDVVVPAGTTHVYVGVDGYEASNDYDVTVELLEPSLRQIASYDVAAGDLFRAVVTATAGDPDLYLRFDAPPTAATYDCRSIYYGDDACDLAIAAAGKVYVAVLETEHPTSYQVSSSVLQASITEADTFAVTAGERLEIAVASSAAVDAYVRFDDAGAWVSLTCSGPAGALVCETQVPGAATSATVGIFPLEGLTTFDVTLDRYRVGCDVAAAGSLSAGNYGMAGVLRAGRHYLITLGGSPVGQYHLNVDEDDPAIEMGAARNNAYLEVLGAAVGARVTYNYATDDDSVLVDGVDGSAPVCRLGLEVTPSVQYTRPALGAGRSAAVRRAQLEDGSVQSTVVVARLDQRELREPIAPAEVSALPPRWDVAAVGFAGEDLLWLEHDADGSRASLKRAYAGVWPPGEACEVHAFPIGVRVSAAALDGSRLLLAMSEAGAAAAVLYDVRDGAGCGSVAEVTRTSAPGDVLAAALDHHDGFLWSEQNPDNGGELLYLSLRDVAPLYASGTERILGFDARGGDVVVSVASSVSDAARTLLISADASTGEHRGVRLLGDDLRHHPRFAGAGLATVRAGAPDAQGRRRPEVVLRPLDEAAFATAGEVVIASAAAYFAGAEPFDPGDPEAWSDEVLVESSGRTLAVLGQDDDGVRRLAVFRVPDDASAFASLVPEHELRLAPAGPSPDVERLSVSDDVVALTFRSALPPVVLRRDDSGATPIWDAVPVGTLDQERVVGVWQGDLLLMRYPGDIYAERPPQHVELFVRDVVTGLPAPGEDVASLGRLPAESYARTFAFVGPGIAGELSLYDDSAASPVLWRLDERGFAVRDDGSHRPLTAGVERARAAGPRSSGEALYFLRNLEGRVSLMRYRGLQ